MLSGLSLQLLLACRGNRSCCCVLRISGLLVALSWLKLLGGLASCDCKQVSMTPLRLLENSKETIELVARKANPKKSQK